MTLNLKTLRAVRVTGGSVVTVRSCLAFAAVTGYRQERYIDDAREGGIEAAPGFVASLEWLVHGRGAHLALFGLSDDERRRTVHAWLDSRFVAPIRAGRSVKIGGRLKDVRQSKAGLQVTARYRIADEATGQLLSVSDTSAVFRDVRRELPGGVPDMATNRPTMRYPGSDAKSELLALDRMFPHVYTECTGIWNPVHTERAAALAAGLPDIIVHGTGMWAVIGRRLGEIYLGNESVKCRRLYAAFRRPVIAGTALVLHHQQFGRRASFIAELPDGNVALEGFIQW